VKIPRPVANLIESFEKLPGIGPKTAQRLAFYLLHFPQEELEKFADALTRFKKDTCLCSICKNVDETDPCTICSDERRDQNLIAVVVSPLDALALEKSGFKGVYHVLHGVINPLNNIGPEELFIKELIARLKEKKGGEVVSNAAADWSASGYGKEVEEGMKVEVVLATNMSMEGESTAMYISKLIRQSGFSEEEVKITRLARGLPVGGDVEYADDVTLSRALEGRTSV